MFCQENFEHPGVHVHVWTATINSFHCYKFISIIHWILFSLIHVFDVLIKKHASSSIKQIFAGKNGLSGQCKGIRIS